VKTKRVWTGLLTFLFFISFILAGLIIPAESPAQAGDPVAVKIQIPFSKGGKQGLAIAGSEISAYIMVENQTDEEQNVDMEISLPKEFKPVDLSSSWKMTQTGDSYILTTACTLAVKYENWFDLIPVRISSDIPAGEYRVAAKVKSNGKEQKLELPVKLATRREAADFVKISEILLPTDEYGKVDPRYQRNTLALKSSSSSNYYKRVITGAGTESTAAEHPIAHMAVKVANKNAEAASLLITAQLLNPETKKPVAGFRPPNAENLSKDEQDRIYAMVKVPGKSETLIPLPIYGEEGTIPTGKFTLRTTVKLLGSDAVLQVKDLPVQVVARDFLPAVITVSAFVLIAGTFGIINFRKQAFFDRFKTRWLIVIALFGTATFVTVNIPGTILWDLSHAIFGPFSFLITGLFNEIILYMLLVSLVLLIPQPGTVLLATVMRMLLSGVILGHFSPVTIMFYSTSGILLEVMLFIFGITRSSWVSRKLSQAGRADIWPAALVISLGCGLADAASAFVNFQITIFLYRLYYADWYILTYVLIDGFLYTAIGTVFGVLLGRQLKKVAID